MSTLNQIQVRDPRNLTVVGDTLYLRGYKQQSYPAPLLELWKSDAPQQALYPLELRLRVEQEDLSIL
jgi:hypothetical protein